MVPIAYYAISYVPFIFYQNMKGDSLVVVLWIASVGIVIFMVPVLVINISYVINDYYLLVDLKRQYIRTRFGCSDLREVQSVKIVKFKTTDFNYWVPWRGYYFFLFELTSGSYIKISCLSLNCFDVESIINEFNISISYSACPIILNRNRG